jgi:ABC-2 type transport system ATP-binding protein
VRSTITRQPLLEGSHVHAVTVRDVRKRFGSTDALSGVDLDVEEGETLGLLGPNGAGKTTLVRILATLLPPDGGQARIFGHDVVTEAHVVRRMIGLTGQYAAVDELLTGRENLRMFGELFHLRSRDARLRADDLLERFDLMDAADRPARTYSGGMRRRLDLASSLLVRPELLFLDEPTTGLDPRSRNAIWEVAQSLVAEGTTLLLTTQYLEEADQLADRIAVIDHGRIVAEGTADELKRRIPGGHVRLQFPDADASVPRAAVVHLFAYPEAASYHHGEHPEVVLVHQLMLQQRPVQLTGTELEDVLTRLLLELGDLLDHVRARHHGHDDVPVREIARAIDERRPVLDEGPEAPVALIMDRAYEGDETRQLALDLGFTPVVPPRTGRINPWSYDEILYRRRNEIERLFRRLKGFRRIFSRFEKLDVMFTAFIHFALVVEALRPGIT